MTRKLKAALLVAATALVVSASAAPATQAEPFFSSELKETAISSPSTTTSMLHLAGMLFVCNVDFSGTQKESSTTTELQLDAQFTSCTFFEQPALISTNGCRFAAHANGEVDIISKTGKNCATEPMTIAWPGCLIEIGPKSGLVGLNYQGTGEQIILMPNVAEIKYKSTGCGKTGTFEDGRYTSGSTTLTGAEVGGEGKMTNISWTRPALLFHSDLEETAITSTADGTGETAHQVFDVAGTSLTCSGVSVTGKFASVFKATSKAQAQFAFSECTFLGEATTVEAKGCNFTLRAHGPINIGGEKCASEPIRWEVTGASPCKVEIGTQIEINEFNYHSIKPGANEEITLEAGLAGMKYTASGKGCPKAGTFEDGRYTGNVILTGAEVGGEGKMTNIWVE